LYFPSGKKARHGEATDDDTPKDKANRHDATDGKVEHLP